MLLAYMTYRKNCCLRPKIAICALERAHTFFELCVQNYVGTLLEVFTNKIYIYNIYNTDYINIDYNIHIDCVDCRLCRLYIFTLKASTSTGCAGFQSKDVQSTQSIYM